MPSGSDDVVKRFKAGREAWERPLRDQGITTQDSEPAKKTKTIRARGTARINRRASSAETAALRQADDRVVKQFKQGLARWERPIETPRRK